jgi:hypothetical protein
MSSWNQYVSWAREKYSVGTQRANKLWLDAWEAISVDKAEERGIKREVYLQDLERIKTTAEEEGDRATAVKCIALQAKLEGLDIQKIEMKTEVLLTKWGVAL